MTDIVYRAKRSELDMEQYRRVTFGLFAAIAVALAAIHCPGQMSVDSVSALYETATRTAVGWGPTFFSAFLAWMGGSLIGASLFVGLNCYVVYGCFAGLLTNPRSGQVPRWQLLIAFVFALNPLFMFYVGIIWKDVMLGTAAMAASTLLLLAAGRSGRARHVLLALTIIPIASLTLIRQQGFLLALPLSIAMACLASGIWGRMLGRRLTIFVICIAIIIGFTSLLNSLASSTVRPAANSPVSVGFLTIRAYDIAGMIKYSARDDANTWADASEAVKGRIRVTYSPERIDTFWHDPVIRGYLNSLDATHSWSVWRHGIEHDPKSYVKHRISAMRSLLGFQSIEGCVPAYWGVAGISEQMTALSLQEQMDVRARMIGRISLSLHNTPVFRHWFYALLLLVATVLLFLRFRGERRWVAGSVAAGAWLYLGSFVPTTIACDFRYLYPVAGLSTILCIFLLSHTAIFKKNLAS